MSTTGNLCVWNPLNIGSGGSTTLSEGNTTCVMTGADPRTTGTIAGIVTDTDGFYFETVATATGSGALTLGIVIEDRHNQTLNGQIHSRSGSWMWRSYDGGVFMIETSSNTSYGTFADGDILGWFVKAGKLYVKKNNSDVVGDVSAGSGGLTLSGHYFFPAVSRTVGGGSGTTAILRPDSDSWSYTPPSGFKGLTAKDMTISADIDPAGDDGETENPTKQFNAITYTGNGSTNAISNLGFKPDLIWIKGTNDSTDNRLVDSTRGVGVALRSNADGGDVSEGNGVTAFGTDGFTLGSETGYNGSSINFVSWCWKANGGTTASNSNGSITSTVQVGKGFSIMAYTGTGSNATIGHSLSAKPDFILTKRRSSQQTWGVYHTSLGATKYLALNTNANAGTDSTFWNNTEPTTSVISLGTEGRVNGNSQTYVAYAWHNVEGMQRFSTYIGNGNTNGQFLFLGFRPRLFVTKKLGTDNWVVIDSARETFNVMGEKVLLWDTADTEFDPSAVNIDFVSNGVKMRNTDGKINASGTEYVYMAWADQPAKFSNAF